MEVEKEEGAPRKGKQPQKRVERKMSEIKHEHQDKRDLPGGPVIRLHAPNAGGRSLIPGQGTRSHMPKLKPLHAATRKWRNQIKKQILKNK